MSVKESVNVWKGNVNERENVNAIVKERENANVNGSERFAIERTVTGELAKRANGKKKNSSILVHRLGLHFRKDSLVSLK